MARKVSFADVPDTALIPPCVADVQYESLEFDYTDAGILYADLFMSIVAPKGIKGLQAQRRFWLGDDDDPECELPETQKRRLRALKRAFKVTGLDVEAVRDLDDLAEEAKGLKATIEIGYRDLDDGGRVNQVTGFFPRGEMDPHLIAGGESEGSGSSKGGGRKSQPKGPARGKSVRKAQREEEPDEEDEDEEEERPSRKRKSAPKKAAKKKPARGRAKDEEEEEEEEDEEELEDAEDEEEEEEEERPSRRRRGGGKAKTRRSAPKGKSRRRKPMDDEEDEEEYEEE